MSWKLSGRLVLIGILASLVASGCGSLSQLSGEANTKKKARSNSAKKSGWGRRPPLPGFQVSNLQQVGLFTGTFDGRTGELTIEPEVDGVRTRATQYGPRHALSLTGTGAPIAGGILRGTVTLSSSNPVELLDCRAVLLSISTTGVTAHNPDGVSSVSGTQRPYWEYGTLRAGQPPVSRVWEFKNSGGVSFTFRVAIFANTWSPSTGDGSSLSACSFVNATTGWAVGGRGKILATTDGGASWTVQNAGVSHDLKDVFFISATHGWAVGTLGKIIATTDGGVTWRHQTATFVDSNGTRREVFVTLYAVTFLNATTGIAVGDNGTIVRTTNGGATWQQVFSDPDSADTLYDVSFANATTGWAVGSSSTVLRTTDGGQTWTPQTIPDNQKPFPFSPGLNTLLSVHAIDSSRVCAVGAGGWVLLTGNGGATWTRKNNGSGAPKLNLNALFFANDTVGWAIGAQVLLKTTDGGNTWTQMPAAAGSLTLFGLAGLAGNTERLWTVGQNGIALYSTNGGTSWLRPGESAGAMWVTTGSTINALWFVGATHGWAVGEGSAFIRTVDAGRSWRAMVAPPGGKLEDVHFVDANNGWTVGAAGRLMRTTNGGQTWTSVLWPGLEVGEGGTVPGLFGVRFFDIQTGWVVGNNTTILKTTDGGETWEYRFPPVSGSFRKIAWLNRQRGWIVGSNGIILSTDDGGDSWSILASGTERNLNQIAVVPAGPSGVTVWVVGDQGVLLRSSDGVGFEPIDLGRLESFQGVSFLPDGRTGWIAGDNGLLYRTTDGGNTWRLIDAGTSNPLKTIFARSADEVWLGGQGGTLRVFR